MPCVGQGSGAAGQSSKGKIKATAAQPVLATVTSKVLPVEPGAVAGTLLGVKISPGAVRCKAIVAIIVKTCNCGGIRCWIQSISGSSAV